jgi:hypothetical protein
MSDSNSGQSNFETQEAKLAEPSNVLKRCLSPTVGWTQLAGWLLLGSMLLPLAEGCDGKNISTASGIQRLATQDSTFEFLMIIPVLWVQSNVLIWSTVFVVVALVRKLTIARWALRLQLAATVLLLLACTIWASVDSSTGEILGSILGLGPVVVLSGIWLWYGHRSGDWHLLWSRAQHTWLLTTWIWMQLQCIFIRELLWGYFVTMAIFLVAVIAIETARHRMDHDLIDASIPASKPRFSIKAIFAWITGLALFIAYYQQVGFFTDWLKERL